MVSIFKQPHSVNRQARNAFDLSNRSVYSNRVGLLQPCFVREVNPNEHFSIDVDSFVRTQPLNTAAFVRVKQNIDFFFVPYRVLWHNFGNFFTNTEYRSRSFNNYGLSMPIPFFSVDLAKNLFDLCSSNNYQDYMDMFGINILYGASRLLEMLEYGHFDFLGDKIDSDGNFLPSYRSNVVALNPFRLLAYQKIYQDFYRNPLYETYDSGSCNIDDVISTGSTPNVGLENLVSESRFASMFTLRYANFKKDYFTCLRPSFSGADFFHPGSLSLQFNSNSNVIFTDLQTSSNSDANSGGVVIEDNYLSANNIRAAFALDKLVKLMERAKDGSYEEQIFSRFGVRPRSDADSSIFLNAFTNNIQISEVVSTSDTMSADFSTGEALGRIAGRGLSSGNGHFEFDSSEHGIIMGVESFVPELDYDSIGLSRFNTLLSSSDYFNPELDNLGYQPIHEYELRAPYKLHSYDSKGEDIVTSVGSSSHVLGYAPRFLNYKTSYDTVHGAFKSNGSLSAWASAKNPDSFDSPQSTAFTHPTYSSGLSYQFMKVSPFFLDSVFTVTGSNIPTKDISFYKLNPVLMFDYDQFLVNTTFRVQALRPMSVYGLPNI